MTTLREAAQQALRVACMCTPEQQIAKEALRTALAQQTQTPCDIAEDGVCEVIDCCRNPAQILEALEIGYDSAQAEAAQYHAAMAGYRPERHAAMDADVQKIAKAISTLKAALAQEEQEPTVRIKCTVVDDRHPNGVPFEQWVNAPRREWQGLTEEVINDGRDQLPTEDLCGWSFRQGVYFAEKALKERNHG